MINLKNLKKNFHDVKKQILRKDPYFPVDRLMLLFDKHNNAIAFISELKEQVNKKSAEIQSNPNLLNNIRIEVKNIKKKIEEEELKASIFEDEFYNLLLTCPNILFDEVPDGGKESNQVIRSVGTKFNFHWIPFNHVDLLSKKYQEKFSFGAQVAKSGFFAYEDKLAWLIYRLAGICLKHNEKKGFRVIHLPQVANKEVLINASNLPRFKDELFFLENDNLILIPTAEVILASYCQGKFISVNELPIRLTAWTKCYRKEVGGYGAQERGLIRMHEFEKIEIFSYCHPDKSYEEHNFMIECVEELLSLFDLHYQVVLLAAQDCSFASAKTYDIEVWLPGQKQYKEISSISNCTDFQSRRGHCKYKNNKESDLLHTLNGSSLALPRLMVALIETWQTESGEINFDGLFNLISHIEKKL